MGDTVFVNGRAAVHKGSSGKSVAFPDVCLCPPTPPAGPVPLPLPNSVQAADLQGGATSVLIEGNPMGKKSSFIMKSTGDEASQSTGGGVVTHMFQGKAYFGLYSMTVLVEGEEAVRAFDLVTHNHMGMKPGNTPPMPWLAPMSIDVPSPSQHASKHASEGKDWIELCFLDQEDNPVPVRYVLETPANKRLTGRVFSSGSLRVSGLAKGNCRLTLQRVDEPPRRTRAFTGGRSGKGKVVQVKTADLTKPQTLATGSQHTLRLQLPVLQVRLSIDPSEADASKVRFILKVRGKEDRYRIVRTVKDDQVPGDKSVDLVFRLFDPTAQFTLVVDPGKPAQPYNIFADAKFEDLFRG